jgi:hypothetical protein
MWMEVAQDRVHWRAFLLTALELMLAMTVLLVITNEVTCLSRTGLDPFAIWIIFLLFTLINE